MVENLQRREGKSLAPVSVAWLNAGIMKISSYKVITCLPVIEQIPGEAGRTRQVFNYLNFSQPRLYHI